MLEDWAILAGKDDETMGAPFPDGLVEVCCVCLGMLAVFVGCGMCCDEPDTVSLKVTASPSCLDVAGVLMFLYAFDTDCVDDGEDDADGGDEPPQTEANPDDDDVGTLVVNADAEETGDVAS